MPDLPASSRFVVVGAGIHGLSTAYHLAKELRTRGLGSGRDVVVLEKSEPGAGASGIACGVVRNNYFQPAMSELMQACVEVWESDPAAYAYNPVGYVALGPAVQEPDLAATYERQEQIGYRSELITGEAEVDAHMKELFPDWRAKGVTACLHEHQGGFAFNRESVLGLAGKCGEEGVDILTGVEVKGIEAEGGGTVRALETSRGRIEVGEQLVIAPGPWAKRFWAMLELPMSIDVRTPSGELVARPADVDVLEPPGGRDHGRPAHVRHGRRERPAGDPPRHRRTALHGRGRARHRRALGHLLQARPARRAGRRLAARRRRGRRPRPLPVDDGRRPVLPGHVVRRALARDGALRGLRPRYKTARSGGVGAFTADNFPVFDYMRPNAYAVLDSNHGYKMIGVGREVAKVLLGEHSSLLYPFRFERFATGDLHPVSHSPYPWS